MLCSFLSSVSFLHTGRALATRISLSSSCYPLCRILAAVFSLRLFYPRRETKRLFCPGAEFFCCLKIPPSLSFLLFFLVFFFFFFYVRKRMQMKERGSERISSWRYRLFLTPSDFFLVFLPLFMILSLFLSFFLETSIRMIQREYCNFYFLFFSS